MATDVSPADVSSASSANDRFFCLDQIDYLTGAKFSNALKVTVGARERDIAYRMEYLEALARGRRVIHWGCADHLPLIMHKVEANVWMHKRLCDVSERCLGVDIDQGAIDFIKSQLGYSDVYRHDAEHEPPLSAIVSSRWDYLIMGELLEHVDNPVQFLSQLRDRYGRVVDKVVLTVPNAFALTNIREIIRNREFINSDHRYWFTPYTLAKVLVRAGLGIEGFRLCETHRPSRRLDRFLLRRFPIMRESIVMIGRFS